MPVASPRNETSVVDTTFGVPGIVFRREANAWLEDVRVNLAAQMSPAIGPVRVDVLDALRVELNQKNGSALSKQRAPARDAPDLRPPLWRRLGYVWKRELGRRRVQPPDALHDATVLAVARMADHVGDQLPVAERLRDLDGLRTLFCVADDAFADPLRRAGFAATGFFSNPARETARAYLMARHVRASLRSLVSERAGRPDEKMLGQLTYELVDARCLDALRAFLSASRLIDAVRPAVVLLSNPNTLEGRVMGRVAQAHGVPVVAIEHGSIFPDDPAWWDCPVDRVCVWGEPSGRALAKCGLPEEKIVVTGAVRYEPVFARNRVEKTAGKPCILVATSGSGDSVSLEQHRAFIATLHRAALEAPELHWMVKLHKKDAVELYEREGRSGALELVKSPASDDGSAIFGMLAHAQALVTVASTSALDAMAMGVPVITVDVWGGRERLGVEFLERPCTLRVSGASDLAAAARRAAERRFDEAVLAEAERYAAEHFANRGSVVAAITDVVRRAARFHVAAAQ
jgi:hypothetical protein